MRRRLPKDLTGGKSQVIGLMADEVAAIETAKAALLADPRFEHMSRVDDDVWQFASRCHVDRRSAHVPAFIEHHGREPIDAVCYIPVEFLVVKAEVDVFGIRLLPLTNPCVPPDRPWFPHTKPTGSVAAVEVRGTDYGKMADRARAATSHALRVLRVALRSANYGINDHQLRFRMGIGYAFVEALTGWNQSEDIAYDLELGGNVLIQVLSQPVSDMPATPSNDLEKKADRALRWMERATFASEPLVAMLYLFFALEALLGDMSYGKAHLLAFREMTLSHIVTGMFRNPHETLFLYKEVRNGAVHGDEVPEVTWTDAQQLAWAVRETLSNCLTLAKQRDLNSRAEFLRAIDDPPDRPDLIAWLRQHGSPTWTQYLDKIERQRATR